MEVSPNFLGRYESVLAQMNSRTSSLTVSSNSQRLKQLIAQTFGGFSLGSSHASCTLALWAECEKIYGSPIHPLKQKFMLRQFTDEMKSSERLGVVKALAFNWPCNQCAATPTVTKEIRSIFDAGLLELSQVLFDRCDSLSECTDMAIDEKSVLTRCNKESVEELTRVLLIY